MISTKSGFHMRVLNRFLCETKNVLVNEIIEFDGLNFTLNEVIVKYISTFSHMLNIVSSHSTVNETSNVWQHAYICLHFRFVDISQLPSHSHQIQIKRGAQSGAKIEDTQANEKWQLKDCNV